MTRRRSRRLSKINSRRTQGRIKSQFNILHSPENTKKPKYPLFSQVVLQQDFPKHNLKSGSVGTVVEQYSLNGKYGYSLEGFDLPNITLEVSEEQISTLPILQTHIVNA